MTSAPTITIADAAATAMSGGPSIWTYAWVPLGSDGTATVTVAGSDLAGNAYVGTTNLVFTIDNIAPTLSPVAIISNNATTSLAKEGDIITLTFTSNEAISTPTVTIAGDAATVTGGPTSWSASYTVTNAITVGLAAINVAFSDLAGNAGTPVTAVTDASSVTIDQTKPVILPLVVGWGAYLNAVEDNSNVTISVTTTGVEDGQTVTLNLNGTNYTNTITANATTITIPALDLQKLAEGSHTITTNVSDAAGNAADPVTADFIYDITPPTMVITATDGIATAIVDGTT